MPIHVKKDILTVICQANNETNTGFVIWPSALILAHHLVNKSPHLVLGTDDDLEGDILELGAGSLVHIALLLLAIESSNLTYSR